MHGVDSFKSYKNIKHATVKLLLSRFSKIRAALLSGQLNVGQAY